MKAKKKNSILEQVKSARKQSREEEIQTHGKSINYRKVMANKKQYNRKKNKADDEVLPYLFISPLHLERGLRGEVTRLIPFFQQVKTFYHLV